MKQLTKGFQGKSSISPKAKAAYCQALLNVCIGKADKLQAEINRQFPKPSAFDLKAAERSQTVKNQFEKRKQEEEKHKENLPILKKELFQLSKEISFYDAELKKLNISPTDQEIADVLLQLSVYYGNIADKAEKSSPQHTEALALKMQFGDACDKSLCTLHNSIKIQVNLKKKQAEKRLQGYLKKNLVFTNGSQNCFNFTDDYNAAKRVVDTHFKDFREKNPGVKYFNPAYLSADPFLGAGEPDIDELFPKDISDKEFEAHLHSLYKSILFSLTAEKDHNFVSDNIGNICTLFSGTPSSNLRVNNRPYSEYSNPITAPTIANPKFYVLAKPGTVDQTCLHINGKI